MAQVSIFVSHSHQDNDWCRPLVAALKAVGYDVWYDESGLAGGAAWVATIQREVQSRDIFLLVLTPEAWSSEWVQDELQLAIATRRRILPVLLRNTQVDGFILTTQWVTVVGEDPQVAARSIITAIETPPAPGRNVAPKAESETLQELATLCRSLLTERRYTEALSACDRALTLDPDNADVLGVKGVVLDHIGQKTNAAAVFARWLLALNPATINSSMRDDTIRAVRELSYYVMMHSGNAETITQIYRLVSRGELAAFVDQGWLVSSPSELTSVGFIPSGRPAGQLPLVIRRLSDLGATDAISDLVSDFNGSGQFARDVFTVLAQAGQTEPLQRLAARLEMESSAFLALVDAGHRSAATQHTMQKVAQVANRTEQEMILSSLDSKGSYETIDGLCRQWYGCPPSRSATKTGNYTDQAVVRRSFDYWSRALERLGHQHEASVVNKFVKRHL